MQSSIEKLPLASKAISLSVSNSASIESRLHVLHFTLNFRQCNVLIFSICSSTEAILMVKEDYGSIVYDRSLRLKKFLRSNLPNKSQ